MVVINKLFRSLCSNLSQDITNQSIRIFGHEQKVMTGLFFKNFDEIILLKQLRFGLVYCFLGFIYCLNDFRLFSCSLR